MITATTKNSTSIVSSEGEALTRHTGPDDWFLPEDDWLLSEVEPTWNATTMDASDKSAGSVAGTTYRIAPRRESEPIRKDSLRPKKTRKRVKLLQQWECIVLGIQDDCVECEMHDLTDESQPVEFAEVYLDEFNVFDRDLLHEGSVFYWSIGHETSSVGQVRRYSDLRVRRMPPLSNLRKREIAKRAEQLSEQLKLSAE